MGYYLRDIECGLPPGFRFHPSDEELVCHYLYQKVNNRAIYSINEGYSSSSTMAEVDLHTHEPWQLPEVAKLSTNEWYFFSIRDRKYATGSRTNRATKCGYWKATGKDRRVYGPSSHEMMMKKKDKMVVGMRKTLVFYRGRAPNGIKSGWVMHEFRLHSPTSPPKEDWVLCRVFHKKKREEEQVKTRSCLSRTMVSSPPLVNLKQPFKGEESCGELGCTSIFGGPHEQNINNSSSTSFIDMANLVNYNYIDLTPQVKVGSTCDEFGFLLGVNGTEEGHGMEYGNLGEFRFHMDANDEAFSSRN